MRETFRSDHSHRAASIEPLEPRRLLSTVTVNTHDVHQTIAGLGGNYALGAIIGPYTGQAQDAVGELTLQYLSPTEARVGLPMAQWAPTATGGYQDSGLVHNVFLLLQELQKKGITITLTTWNIPDWMCSNPTASTGREVAAGDQSLYANAVASFIHHAKGVYGVNISYFSVNEADGGGYNVSLSTAQEASLIKTTGANFVSDHLKTKWLVGDTFDVSDATTYISAILQTPDVLPFVGGISYHTWWSDSLPASDFTAIATLAGQYHLSVFATEVGIGPQNMPDSSTWDFASQLAQMYYSILGPGEVNAAMDWEFQDDVPLASTTGQAYPAFDVLQQIDNTFTPGTEVVDASSSDASLLPLADLNPRTKALSLQIQNTSAAAESVTLKGLPAGTYTIIRTTEAHAETIAGTIKIDKSGTATVTLPANSFTTFTTSKVWPLGDK